MHIDYSYLQPFRLSIIRMIHSEFIILLSIKSTSLTFFGVLFLFFIFMAFLVSGAEVAYSGLRPSEINTLKTKSDAGAKRITELLENRRVLYGSLVSAHIFLYLGVIIISGFLMHNVLPPSFNLPWAEIPVKTLLIAAILLLFCEVLPKVWARQDHLAFATFSSWWIYTIVFPLFKITGSRMAALGSVIEKGMSGETTQSEQAEELEQAIDLMSEEEATTEEKKILKGIQQFANTVVKQVMKSRLDVAGIEYSSTFADVISRITEQHYSRFPVYKNNLDEIVGVLHTKDLVTHIDEAQNFHWQQLVRTPYFVPEQKPIEDLLKEFQQKHIHFAIVVDEFGGTSGIITMEDILEEIIGEIKDEFDEEETINARLDEYNYLFEGKTMIHDACRIMQIPIDHFDKERGESESVAGLVLELAERLPKTGEMIHCKGFTFAVMDMNANRVEKIKITTPSNIS